MQNKDRPLGVTLLGLFNLVVLGISSFLFAIFPRNWQLIITAAKESGLDIKISTNLFKIVIILQALVALIFITCGVGLLLGKEWGRKLTVYFALLIVIIFFVSALAVPSLISQVILQTIYPGILILYLTRKNVEEYFKK
jgi:hypothetical protein